MAFDDDYSSVRADTAGLERSLTDLDRLARGFGRSLSSALEGAAVRGRSLSDVLRGLGERLVDLALRSAMRPLESGIAGLLGSVAGSVMPFAKGGVVPRVQPFASGGVVSTPSFFPMGRGTTGLMGEAGAEAILPLARGADGRLGVRSGGGGGTQVTVNISTPDADSFRRSEAQVSAALARAVARGRRGM